MSYLPGCRRGKIHRFDYYSGHCVHGCGVRDDGRQTNRAGVILDAGPTYTADELERFRTRHERRSR